jgi:hypothetical protein
MSGERPSSGWRGGLRVPGYGSLVTDPWSGLGAWLEMVAALPQRTAAEALAIVARRFEGRRLELLAAGRPLQLLIHGVEIRVGANSHQVRAELRDVRWDGWLLDTVRAAAPEVRLSMFPQGQVAASGVRVDGRTSLSAAVASLDGHVPGWHLCVRDDGRVEARHAVHADIALSVEVVARDHRLLVEVCGVSWRSLRLSLPSALRWRRTVPLPALPGGATVVCARRDGNAVDVQLAVPEISRSLGTRPLAAG